MMPAYNFVLGIKMASRHHFSVTDIRYFLWYILDITQKEM